MARASRPCAVHGCPQRLPCPIHPPPGGGPRSASSAVTGTRQWRERTKPAILERDGRTCAYCGAPADTVDHVRPMARGGSPHDAAGLVAACTPCNTSKGGGGR